MANMHLVTGYAGREHVTADDQASFNASFFGEESFVLRGKDKFDYEIISNTEVKIKPGDFYSQGRFIRLQNPVNLNFEVGSQGGIRTDSVYIKYEKNPQTEIEECNLIVIDGRNTEALKKAKQQSLKKDAILKGEKEAYFLIYTVQFNGLNLSNIQKNFEVKENYKKEFEKFVSNADIFLKNKVKQTREDLDSLIKKTGEIGELKNLNTKNKTNLVNAINEVFQFGVDKGNKIVSKLNALFDEDMKNLEEVANEIDKYDVKYKTISFNKKDVSFYDTFNIFSNKIFYYSENYINDYNAQYYSGIYDLNTESNVKCTYVSSDEYDFKNSTNLYTAFKNRKNIFLFNDSSNKIIHITDKYINFSLENSHLIRLNDKYLLINLDGSKINVYDMTERKIIKTINFDNSLEFLDVQNNKIYLIDKRYRLILILNSNFQKIRSIQLYGIPGYSKDNFFILNNIIIFFHVTGDEQYIFVYDADTGNILKKINYKKIYCFSKKNSLVSGISNDDKIYFIKNVSNINNTKYYRMYSFDKNMKEIDMGEVKNISSDIVVFKNKIFYSYGDKIFKILKELERR